MKGALWMTALVLVTACGGNRVPVVQRDSPFTEQRPAAEQVQIHVENRNFSDARLFAVALGRRIRLGVVGGKDAAVFRVPWSRPEPLQIEIDLLAGPRCMTRAIDADPGDTLDLQIEAVFTQTVGCRKD